MRSFLAILILAALAAGCATGPSTTCTPFSIAIIGAGGDSTGKVAHGEACVTSGAPAAPDSTAGAR